MLDKDELLEDLFETRGIGDAEWRGQLSRKADQVLIDRATKLPAAVLAPWWHHPGSPEASGTPNEWLLSLPGEIIEVHCICSPSIAASRFIARTRHPGHVDGRHTFEVLLATFQSQVTLGPLAIGRTIEVSTETEPSFESLLGQLGCDPSENRCHAQPAA